MTIERDGLEQLIDHNWRLWQIPEGDVNVEGNISTGLNIAWLKWKETGEIPPLESRIKMNMTGAGGEGCEFDTTPYWLEKTEEQLAKMDSPEVQGLIDRTIKTLERGYRVIVWRGLTPIGYIDELEWFLFHGKTGSGLFPWVTTLHFKRSKTGEMYKADIAAETEEKMEIMINDLIKLSGKQ